MGCPDSEMDLLVGNPEGGIEDATSTCDVSAC